MLERTLEHKFVEAAKASGGWAPKFTSPGFDGMPDRIVLRRLGSKEKGPHQGSFSVDVG